MGMWMNPIGQWFRSKRPTPKGGGAAALAAQLKEIESSAADASLMKQGSLFNRAGHLCLKAGDRFRALHYMGRAIDAFLGDERPALARGVAMEIIRVHPEAVRTLCTLTWLDLASHQFTAAKHHLQAYLEAAERIDQRELAGDQILKMAGTVPEKDFLTAAADALETLGFSETANQVHDWALVGGSADAASDPEKLVARCLEAAVGSNARRRAEGAPA
jgi:hypothetical protein